MEARDARDAEASLASSQESIGTARGGEEGVCGEDGRGVEWKGRVGDDARDVDGAVSGRESSGNARAVCGDT